MDKDKSIALNLLQVISDYLHFLIRDNFPDALVLWSQILAKFILLFFLIYVVSFLIRIFVKLIFKIFIKEDRYPVLNAIQKSKITRSFASFSALLFGGYALYSVFWRHPKSFDFLEIIINVSIVIVLAGVGYRALNAIEFYYLSVKDYYRIVALRAIKQTVKIFGIFMFSAIAISIIFKISSSTILGSLGAITAVLVLVFRDTILGFVTGLHVATSRNLKTGDWIGIPKYNLEGTIEDINLLTTKILNFDKTVSTIPTYDLLSTEIKNLQVMAETNTRRIKRSIVFDINSFQFVDEELFAKLIQLNLLKDYLNEKRPEIFPENEDSKANMNIMNGAQLTNIGVFRVYALSYLKSNQHIDQKGTLMVRQLESTPQGMPLEIYAFTNDSDWEIYEEIQSDIFDHLLVAAKEFNLKVVQLTRA